jgi:hypothetical protein
MARSKKNLMGSASALPSSGSPADADELDEEFPRDKELVDIPFIRDQLMDLYDEAAGEFENENERADEIEECWDAYNCELGDNQVYDGNSQIFVPIIRTAVNARKTRYLNQLFPTTQRHVRCVSTDGGTNSATVSLLEHYIRKAKLRTKVGPALLRAGDIEGQYSIYVSWCEKTRDVVWKTQAPLEVQAPANPNELPPVPGEEEEDPAAGMQLEETGIEDPNETVDDMDSERVYDAHPLVEVISDADIVVFPATADGIEEAIEDGGGVAIARKWRKPKIKQMIREGRIDKKRGERLIDAMEQGNFAQYRIKDPAKIAIEAAGIHEDENDYYLLVYETYAKIELKKDEEPKLVVIYFAGETEDDILSCKRNPYWCDRVPVFSTSAEKVKGSFKGKSQISPVLTHQYQANDAVNEGMDAAAYALLPIIMTDPEKNPRVGSMILSLAAVWECDPNSTKFAEFPPIWKDAFNIVSACKSEIFEAVSVTPAMLTQQTAMKKLTQAEIAADQETSLMQIADQVSIVEQEIFTPMLAFFVELDHQFRDEPLFVQKFGEMGLRAEMEEVPPIQFDSIHSYEWFGVESSQAAQMIQMQISTMNVVATIPSALYQGYKINLAPAITQLVENVFGPRLAPLIFEDIRSQLSMDPQKENELLNQGIDLPVHPMENHQEHMAVHQQDLQDNRDESGMVRGHLMKHQMALHDQMQAQAMAMMGGPPGAPTGPQGPPGGRPKPGGQAQMPTGQQAPPGAIHPDQLNDPSAMPRRTMGMPQ